MKIKSESFDGRVLKWGGGVMLAFLVGTPMMMLSGQAGADSRDGHMSRAPQALMAACEGTMKEQCAATPSTTQNCREGRRPSNGKPKGVAKL